MPVFRYAAKDKIGKIHRGQLEADDEKTVESKLRDAGFKLIEVSLNHFKEAPKGLKDNFFDNRETLIESSMETCGQKQVTNSVNSDQKSLKIVVAATIALVGIILWLFIR